MVLRSLLYETSACIQNAVVLNRLAEVGTFDLGSESFDLRVGSLWVNQCQLITALGSHRAIAPPQITYTVSAAAQ